MMKGMEAGEWVRPAQQSGTRYRLGGGELESGETRQEAEDSNGVVAVGSEDSLTLGSEDSLTLR